MNGTGRLRQFLHLKRPSALVVVQINIVLLPHLPPELSGRQVTPVCHDVRLHRRASPSPQHGQAQVVAIHQVWLAARPDDQQGHVLLLIDREPLRAMVGNVRRALLDLPIAHSELRGMDLLDGHLARGTWGHRRVEPWQLASQQRDAKSQPGNEGHEHRRLMLASQLHRMNK